MKILVINCGSSSLKYQLIDMENENVLCKGNCERVGMIGSFITHKAKGNEWRVEVPFPTHTEAFMKVVEMMTTGEGAV
ncbi:MAG: acetate kinase, partial [Oscillospiraceae bacterium]